MTDQSPATKTTGRIRRAVRLGIPPTLIAAAVRLRERGRAPASRTGSGRSRTELPSAVVRLSRPVAAVVVRRLPPTHRGRSRLLDVLDQRLRHVEPMVDAPMALGYRMRLDLRSRTEFAAYYTGRYDTELIAAALNLFPGGGVAIDVGAHIGFWAVPFARKGEVHAFEPVEANADRLQRNAEMNGVTQSLRVHRLGLSNGKAQASITLREDFQRGATAGNAALVIDDSDDRFNTQAVRLDTLDHQVSILDLTRLDVVKVDIEGHEDQFLLGARRTLEQFRPVLWMEWNSDYFERREVDPTDAVGRALDGLGFTVLRRGDSQWSETAGFSSDRPLDDLVLAPKERTAEVLRVLNYSR